MKTLKGLVPCNRKPQLTWDDALKPGDYISTKYKGYFILERIEERTTGYLSPMPMYHFKKVFGGTGRKTDDEFGGNCFAHYCRKADTKIAQEIKKLQERIETLEEAEFKMGFLRQNTGARKNNR